MCVQSQFCHQLGFPTIPRRYFVVSQVTPPTSHRPRHWLYSGSGALDFSVARNKESCVLYLIGDLDMCRFLIDKLALKTVIDWLFDWLIDRLIEPLPQPSHRSWCAAWCATSRGRWCAAAPPTAFAPTAADHWAQFGCATCSDCASSPCAAPTRAESCVPGAALNTVAIKSTHTRSPHHCLCLHRQKSTSYWCISSYRHTHLLTQAPKHHLVVGEFFSLAIVLSIFARRMLTLWICSNIAFRVSITKPFIGNVENWVLALLVW